MAAEQKLRGSGIEVLGLQGDVRSADNCAQWVQQTLGAFGQLHILVNCAAGAAPPAIADLNISAERRLVHRAPECSLLSCLLS
jgi:NAD(P)-dependent dehydrogenase (short-subunit alcohol dehydrogenase family)